jgi:hypothetical protein
MKQRFGRRQQSAYYSQALVFAFSLAVWTVNLLNESWLSDHRRQGWACDLELGLKSSKQILPLSINHNRMTDMFNAVPVSVCLLIYNGALYIRDAIHSILNQTVIPQEIIVSDSGSSDGSENIVREEARQAQSNFIILPTKLRAWWLIGTPLFARHQANTLSFFSRNVTG